MGVDDGGIFSLSTCNHDKIITRASIHFFGWGVIAPANVKRQQTYNASICNKTSPANVKCQQM